jgi:hypothetical protein
MSLRILQATARDGAAWVGRAFVLFLKRPIAFSALFALFLFAAVVLLALPYVGAVLVLAAWPLLGLAFMIAARSAQGGGSVHAGQLIEPLRAINRDEAQHRRTLLMLCGWFALTNALVMLAGDTLDGGSFERLQVLLASSRTEATQPEIATLLADPDLRLGMAMRLGGTAGLSVLFWHAPALVWWQGQGVAQALFSSALACWRNRVAFLVYGLAWAVTTMLFGLVAGALFALVGAPQLALLAAVPAALVFSTVFYVSLLLTYEGCFGSDETIASGA